MVQGDYLDGRSSGVRLVTLSVADGNLLVSGEGVALSIPCAEVTVDEQLGRAARRLRFPNGACCEVHDLPALDGLLAAMGHRERAVARLQRHMPAILCAGVATLLLVAIAWRWLLPWAAALGARHMPPAVVATLSGQTLKILEGGLLVPSTLDAARRESLNARFRHLAAGAQLEAAGPLLFRASPQLGANAFTLPDGTVILLDELVRGIGHDDQVVAVLGHELGHVHDRHSLQLLLRSSAVAAFLTFYVGDVSQLLAAVPTALLQARFSQEFERQADDYAALLLRAQGLSPQLLADALQTLQRLHPQVQGGGYLSSHPASAERIRHLQELARGAPR
jgi:Zn-dependent protease with chaperone function